MHEFEEYLKRLASQLNVSPRRAEEICAELRSHLEATADQLQQSGVSREEALAEATRIFGEPRAIAGQLTKANHRHRRPQVVRATGLGVIIGCTVYYSFVVTLLLVRVPGASDVWDWVVAVLLGAVPGAVYGMVISLWRIRVRTVAASLAVLAGVLAVSWIGALVANQPAVIGRLYEALGVGLLLGAMALAVSIAVHEWVLKGGGRRVLERRRAEGRPVRLA